MKIHGFKHKGKTVWRFKYKWIDDYHYNLGYKTLTDTFVGTTEDFKEYCQNEQEGQGMVVWDIKKKHAPKEEYEDIYLLWN